VGNVCGIKIDRDFHLQGYFTSDRKFTYSVSSWMRFVSMGTWLSPASLGGTVLGGRLDCGLSGGFG